MESFHFVGESRCEGNHAPSFVFILHICFFPVGWNEYVWLISYHMFEANTVVSWMWHIKKGWGSPCWEFGHNLWPHVWFDAWVGVRVLSTMLLHAWEVNYIRFPADTNEQTWMLVSWRVCNADCYIFNLFEKCNRVCEDGVNKRARFTVCLIIAAFENNICCSIHVSIEFWMCPFDRHRQKGLSIWRGKWYSTEAQDDTRCGLEKRVDMKENRCTGVSILLYFSGSNVRQTWKLFDCKSRYEVHHVH